MTCEPVAKPLVSLGEIVRFSRANDLNGLRPASRNRETLFRLAFAFAVFSASCEIDGGL
jgi:hypothetical protein